MNRLNVVAENFIQAIDGLEEIVWCSGCGEMFLCRHKECPKCRAPNPKFREFSDDDQLMSEKKVHIAAQALNNEVCATKK